VSADEAAWRDSMREKTEKAVTDILAFVMNI